MVSCLHPLNLCTRLMSAVLGGDVQKREVGKLNRIMHSKLKMHSLRRRNNANERKSFGDTLVFHSKNRQHFKNNGTQLRGCSAESAPLSLASKVLWFAYLHALIRCSCPCTNIKCERLFDCFVECTLIYLLHTSVLCIGRRKRSIFPNANEKR